MRSKTLAVTLVYIQRQSLVLENKVTQWLLKFVYLGDISHFYIHEDLK